MDNELLRAIGQLLDEKLEPIKTDVAGLKTAVARLENDVAVLKAGQEEILEEIAEIKESAFEVRTSVGAILDWIDSPEPRPRKLM